jgi:hypothetical protein
MRRLLFLVALAACSSSEPSVSRERVVLSAAPRPSGNPRRPPEWFEQEIVAASADLREGRLEEGLARVHAARAQAPGPEDATALDDLLRRFHQSVLDLPTLVAAMEPERDPITFGEPLRVRIRLKNPGTRRVRVRAKPRKTSPTVFVLDVLRTEYDVRAQVVSSHAQVTYPLRRDLDIPPGGTTEITFTVEESGNERPLDGFRTFRVSGQLRASSVELGRLRRYEAVRLAAATLRSFRPNYEHLLDDPLARVRQALERNAPIHLLTAAALAPLSRRGEAVDLLVAALRGGGAMDLAACACLEYLTNAGLGRDADAWKAWWPRVREHYFDVPEGEGPGEGPRFAAPPREG